MADGVCGTATAAVALLLLLLLPLLSTWNCHCHRWRWTEPNCCPKDYGCDYATAMRSAVTTEEADEEGVFDFGLHTPEAASEGEMVALERFDSLEEKGKSFFGVCEATD